MNDNGIDPGGAAEDRSDADLDAMMAAADDRLLSAISRSLDLDHGLAQIIGDPPRRETSPSDSPVAPMPPGIYEQPDACLYQIPRQRSYEPGMPAPSPDQVGSRIATLRFHVLDVAGNPEDPLGGTAAALLRGAAASLKDLNRGLEARELTRPDATSLLDEVDQALEKALDTQRPKAIPNITLMSQLTTDPGIGRRTRRQLLMRALSWRLLVIFAIISSAITLIRWTGISLLATATSAAAGVCIGSTFTVGMTAISAQARAARVKEAITQAKEQTPVEASTCELESLKIRENLVPETVSPKKEKGPATKMASSGLRVAASCFSYQGSRFSRIAGMICSLRAELSNVQAGVIRLFDDADDCSPQFTPRI